MVTHHMYFAESTDTYGIAFLELPNYNIKKYELLYPCFFVTEPKKHNQFLCWSTGPKTYTFLYHFLVLLYCKKIHCQLFLYKFCNFFIGFVIYFSFLYQSQKSF